MELKPCPFCGAEPLTQEHEPHTHSGPLKAMGIPDHPGSWTIECPTDGCCGMIGSTLDEVATAWNRRAAPAQAEPSDDARDAARYRWLKACNSGSIGITTFNVDEELERVLTEQEADSEIDAAMKKQS